MYLLYLHVAVYMFFHRLYAMYPNNFLAYLRALCNEPSKRNIFQNTIKVRCSLTAFDHWSKTLSGAIIDYGKCSTNDHEKINKNFLFISSEEFFVIVISVDDQMAGLSDYFWWSILKSYLISKGHLHIPKPVFGWVMGCCFFGEFTWDIPHFFVKQ